jgi:thioredoxin reductase
MLHLKHYPKLKMTITTDFDVIIIGGSYAGLSAAMALGRSLRNTLILDSGKPCNRQTPHSHNFITHDGQQPKEIAEQAKLEVLRYDSVKFINDLAIEGAKTNQKFQIKTITGNVFTAKKLLFATGITDLHPIKGMAECWGISILHCPYCHGYEVKHQPTAVIGNGDAGFEYVRMISNWTKELTLFTNGASTLSQDQAAKLQKHGIQIIENEISAFEESDGQVERILLNNSEKFEIRTVFSRTPFKQHSDIPQNLGCEMTEQGFIKVDDFQKTSVHGIYAAGDNSSMFRSVSVAVASGNKAGAMVNKELIEDEF